jgi:ribosomal protein S18 acetylase RimI-like enzyme
VVATALRRRGIADALTRARLERLARPVFYFANERNRASIDLHAPFGFDELTRDFWHPDATFTGGVGILFVTGKAKDG